MLSQGSMAAPRTSFMIFNMPPSRTNPPGTCPLGDGGANLVWMQLIACYRAEIAAYSQLHEMFGRLRTIANHGATQDGLLVAISEQMQVVHTRRKQREEACGRVARCFDKPAVTPLALLLRFSDKPQGVLLGVLANEVLRLAKTTRKEAGNACYGSLLSRRSVSVRKCSEKTSARVCRGKRANR